MRLDVALQTIDRKQLIDQHYYAIAAKATILKPHSLNVPEDKVRCPASVVMI